MTCLDDDHWRDVVGYEELYQVSDNGLVRSKIEKTRIADKENRIMKPKMDNKGYMRVNLHKNGRCRAELINRLVATAFIPNPDNLPQVGHNDDIKTNNDVSNLYWTDSYENNRHNGKLDRFHKAHNAKIEEIARKLSYKIRAASLTDSKELFFDSLQDAHRNGFDEGKISLCINGKRNKHKGYYWERID